MAYSEAYLPAPPERNAHAPRRGVGRWVRALRDRLGDRLGLPLRVRAALREGALRPVGLQPPARSACYSSVVRWDRLGRGGPEDSWCEDPLSLPGLGPPALTRVETQPRWPCEIRRVEALTASHSPLERFACLDSLVTSVTPELLGDVSGDGVRSNLAYRGVRIARGGPDYFVWHQWDGRVVLANSGGAHHFSAARWLAGRVGRRVWLNGLLIRHVLDRPRLTELRRRFHLFAVRGGAEHARLREALRRLGATHHGCPAPEPHVGVDLVFLPRDERRARRVARELSRAGFLDVGAYLERLALSPEHPDLPQLLAAPWAGQA
ncbi:MAG: hypothetical protein QM767_24150 [Anaeromyxobacter sp.]